MLTSLRQAQQQGKVALDAFPIEPQLLAQLQQRMPTVRDQIQRKGLPPVLVVMPQLRPLLSRYARTFAKGLHVLSYNEIGDSVQLDVMGSLG